MSLKTSWEDIFSEETRPKPDVEFIVNLEDGESLLNAHKYLLAIASPVFKEQFYGKNEIIEVKEGNTRVRIKLDASACAAEAFLAYIYHTPIGNLSLKDMLQLLELCERYQVHKLRDYAKECIVKLKHEAEDWDTMREFLWIKEDVNVIEDQDDILHNIWEEDEDMVRYQRDEKMKREHEDWETMREVLWPDEILCDAPCFDRGGRATAQTNKQTLSIKDQDDIQRQIWNEDEEMLRCQYDESEDEGWYIMREDEEDAMREEECRLAEEIAKEKKRQERWERRMANFKLDQERRQREKMLNQCTNAICRNQKGMKCSSNLCGPCCKKQNKVCRGHRRK